MISIIKTDAQYREVLGRVNALAEADPAPETEAGRELEVLALLLQDYERQAFPLALPSPLAAIRLRMDQLSLAPKDLAPYMGSRSKVSEVLAGKRPLSLAMIRALHSGLRIPLESLVSEETDEGSSKALEWDRFPIREMIRRRWIDFKDCTPNKRISFAEARQVMESFFRPVGGLAMAAAVLHKTDCLRTARTTDRFAIAAWTGYVRRRAEQVKTQVEFRRTEWGVDRLRELRSLSRFDVGPRLAVQFLAERGIIIVIEPHLTRTRLDGAALLRADGRPVIGLTLRHDRLDNFWFTLFHELMHVLLHLKTEQPPAVDYSCFIDDLDVAPDISPLEKEADAAAREALLPSADFEASAARFVVAPAVVTQLAQQMGIGDAIVAGRVRHERHNFRLLSSMIGSHEVRQMFPDIQWSSETQ